MMSRLVLFAKCLVSGFLGMAVGYLGTAMLTSYLRLLPFLRVGGIEIRGNFIGAIAGVVLAFACVRSTHRAHFRGLERSGQGKQVRSFRRHHD